MDTYRYHGHSMSDPGSTYRTRDEISNMRQLRDPVEHVRKLLLEKAGADPAELKKIEKVQLHSGTLPMHDLSFQFPANTGNALDDLPQFAFDCVRYIQTFFMPAICNAWSLCTTSFQSLSSACVLFSTVCKCLKVLTFISSRTVHAVVNPLCNNCSTLCAGSQKGGGHSCI